MSNEVNETLDKVARNLAELEKNVAEHEKNWAEHVKDQERRDERLGKYINKIARMVGGMSNNSGKVAEEIFANSLAENPVFGGIHYDAVQKRVRLARGGKTVEFDILMTNGNSVALIEVKFCAHPNDLKKLVDTKVSEFRKWMPAYEGYKLYLGIASLSFNDDIINAAEEMGIGILRQVGKHIEVHAENLKVF